MDIFTFGRIDLSQVWTESCTGAAIRQWHVSRNFCR